MLCSRVLLWSSWFCFLLNRYKNSLYVTAWVRGLPPAPFAQLPERCWVVSRLLTPVSSPGRLKLWIVIHTVQIDQSFVRWHLPKTYTSFVRGGWRCCLLFLLCCSGLRYRIGPLILLSQRTCTRVATASLTVAFLTNPAKSWIHGPGAFVGDQYSHPWPGKNMQKGAHDTRVRPIRDERMLVFTIRNEHLFCCNKYSLRKFAANGAYSLANAPLNE
jgi:hypothetical protein